jgi:hypothetical protein
MTSIRTSISRAAGKFNSDSATGDDGIWIVNLRPVFGAGAISKEGGGKRRAAGFVLVRLATMSNIPEMSGQRKFLVDFFSFFLLIQHIPHIHSGGGGSHVFLRSETPHLTVIPSFSYIHLFLGNRF